MKLTLWCKCFSVYNINISVFITVAGNLFPKVAEKLNQAALPIIDFQTCSKPSYWWDTLRPSMICAGYGSPDELKSACQVRKHSEDLHIQKSLWGMGGWDEGSSDQVMSSVNGFQTLYNCAGLSLLGWLLCNTLHSVLFVVIQP